MNKANFVLVAIAAVALTATLALATGSGQKAASTVENGSNISGFDNNGTVVQVGGGNATVQYTAFTPAELEIKAGQTVSWYNPSQVPEPHTVTFFKDQSQWGNITSDLVVGNQTLMPSNVSSSASNNQNGSIHLLNYFNGSFEPRVIKADGIVESLAGNATYLMDGTENYVNSGWIWPQGQVLEGLMNINSFSIKFEKPGTYDYLCLLHPWMSGKVIVK